MEEACYRASVSGDSRGLSVGRSDIRHPPSDISGGAASDIRNPTSDIGLLLSGVNIKLLRAARIGWVSASSKAGIGTQ